MNIVEPTYKILTPSSPEEGMQILKTMELAARTCYKSEDKTSEGSAEKLIAMLIARDHEAMIEFGDICVKFVTDRGVSHELVRHRMASYAQESTRYVKYGDISVVCAPEIHGDPVALDVWGHAMLACEEAYGALLSLGYKPQIAREVLPTCLKTEIVVKANIREWRHIFEMRTPVTAHPSMRRLMNPLLSELKGLVPVVFDDLEVYEC